MAVATSSGKRDQRTPGGSSERVSGSQEEERGVEVLHPPGQEALGRGRCGGTMVVAEAPEAPKVRGGGGGGRLLMLLQD